MHYHILHKKHTHINTNLSRATHNIHILPITYHVLHLKHTRILLVICVCFMYSTWYVIGNTCMLCVAHGKLVEIRVCFKCSTWYVIGNMCMLCVARPLTYHVLHITYTYYQ
jgi:hypothetical protein